MKLTGAVLMLMATEEVDVAPSFKFRIVLEVIDKVVGAERSPVGPKAIPLTETRPSHQSGIQKPYCHADRCPHSDAVLYLRSDDVDSGRQETAEDKGIRDLETTPYHLCINRVSVEEGAKEDKRRSSTRNVEMVQIKFC